jgi:hypothetical protein
MRVAGDGQAGRGKAMEHVDHVAAGTFAICVISLCPEFDQEPGAAARPGGTRPGKASSVPRPAVYESPWHFRVPLRQAIPAVI